MAGRRREHVDGDLDPLDQHGPTARSARSLPPGIEPAAEGGAAEHQVAEDARPRRAPGTPIGTAPAIRLKPSQSKPVLVRGPGRREVVVGRAVGRAAARRRGRRRACQGGDEGQDLVGRSGPPFTTPMQSRQRGR